MRGLLIGIFLFCGSITFLVAQNNRLTIHKSDTLYNLKNHIKGFYDFSGNLEFDSIKKEVFTSINDSSAHKIAPINWYKFRLKDNTRSKFFTIYFSHIDCVEVYVPYRAGYKKIKNGLFIQKKIQKEFGEKLIITSKTDSIDYSMPFYYANHILSLNSGDATECLPSIVFSDHDSNQKNHLLVCGNINGDKNKINYTFFLSILAIGFILIIINYLISRNLNFLNYGVYLFSLLMVFSYRIPDFYNFYNSLHPKFPPALNGASHYIASFLYIYFFIQFIRIKEKSLYIYSRYIWMIRIIIIFGTFITLFAIFKPTSYDVIWMLVKAFETIMTTIYVYFFIKLMLLKLDNIEKLVMVGSLLLIFGNITTALTENGLFFLWVAIVETIFFFSVISYQNILNNRVRLRVENVLYKEKERMKMMLELDRSKSEFYINITHEFRTPLTVILGIANNLKENTKSSDFLNETRESFEMIERNATSLLKLINKILDLGKIESGNMKLNIIQIDVIPFVKYFVESFHALAQSKQVNLTLYSEVNVLIMDIDVLKLQSIVINLISNAIKFTPSNGKIIVHFTKRVVESLPVFIIKVQDNGLGINEDEQSKIFDRFYQVNSSLYRKNEGTGIGLSLTKEFVELMQGEITVKSELKKGSEFIIQLPIKNDAPFKKSLPSQEVFPVLEKYIPENPIVQSIPKETLLPLALIIEDNTDVVKYLRYCLEGKYETLYATDGDSGIDMAFQHMPDIIICDVMMPLKNGFEVCEILKSNELTNHIPIIILTAKATMKDRLVGLSYGADAYLSKPFLKAELFTRLEQLILVRKKILQKFKGLGISNLMSHKSKDPNSQFLQKTIALIIKNIDNSNFTSAQLAFKLHISTSQLYRKLKATTGKSTALFIRSVRLQKGKEHLQSSNKTISEVAFEVGFNDSSWFSRVFKEEFGYPPSDMRK